MISVERVLARFKQLKTHNVSMEVEPKGDEEWRSNEEGVLFSLVKFADPGDEVVDDFTGAELKLLKGRLRARRRIVRDFGRALGSPSWEKLSKIMKKPKVIIWRYPKIDNPPTGT